MLVSLFRATGGARGLTQNPAGSNLPITLGLWTHIKTIELRRDDRSAGLSAQAAIRAIDKEGYYVTQAGAEFG